MIAGKNMKLQTDLVAQGGSSASAFLRLVGFFTLIFGFVPFYLAFKASGKVEPTTLPRIFYGLLLRLMGFRLRLHGESAAAGPVFFVSNHSSYLDIPTLGAVLPANFVAKSEVSGWPLIGWLARLQNTVFIERRSIRAGAQQDTLRQRLEAGDSLILFPEGTSSDGQRTLPFKSSLFGVVEKPLADGQAVTVQPVSVVATEIGGMPMGREWRPYYAWYGDMTLVKHVWEVFRIGGFTVDIVFHPPVSIKDFGDRKLLADHCQRAVAEGVDRCITGRF